MLGLREMELNFGPQHPSTHGVLRIVLKVDGERIVSARPDIGYLHRGTEKLFETETYPMVIPHTDRLDYVAAATNNHAYVPGGREAPRPRDPEARAVHPRRPRRDAAHLLAPPLARDGRDRPRRDHAVLLHVPRARGHPRPLRGVLRRAPHAQLHARRRPPGGADAGLDREAPRVHGGPRLEDRRVRGPPDREPHLEEADDRRRHPEHGALHRVGRHGPAAARRRPRVGHPPRDPVRVLSRARLRDPDGEERRHVRPLPRADRRAPPEPPDPPAVLRLARRRTRRARSAARSRASSSRPRATPTRASSPRRASSASTSSRTAATSRTGCACGRRASSTSRRCRRWRGATWSRTSSRSSARSTSSSGEVDR